MAENSKPKPASTSRLQISENANLNQKIADFEQIQPLTALLVEHSPNAIAIFDSQMRYLVASQSWYQDYQLEGQNIIGKCHYDLFPETTDMWGEMYSSCVAGNQQTSYEDKSWQSNGQSQSRKWYIHPWFTSDRNFGGIIIFAETIQQNQPLDEIFEPQDIKKQLQQSQQLLRFIIDNIPQSIFWKDSNGVYLGCNRNFAEDAGINLPENIIGKTDYDLPWTKEEADFFRECDRRVIEAGVPELHIQETQLQGDGKQSWIDTNKIPLRDLDNNIIGILGCYEDITERKQAETTLKHLNQVLEAKIDERTQKLRQTEMRLSRLADNVPGMLYQFRLDSEENKSFPYVSSGCRNIYELEPQEIQENPNSVFAFIHDDDIDQLQQTITNSAQSLTTWEYEWRIITTSGQEKWLKGVSQPELQVDNSIIWNGCIVDITERKQTEIVLQQLNEKLATKVEARTAELEQVQSRLEKITDNVPGMIYQFRLDPDGNMSFPYVSSGCREIYEVEPYIIQEKMQRGETLIHPEDVSKFQESVIQSAQNLERWQLEHRIITPSNKIKWIKGISQPQLQADNSILWDGCLIDITSQKQIEAQLIESQQRLQTVISSSPIVLFALDQDGQFTFSDGQGLELLGLKPREVVGTSVYKIYQEYPEMLAQVERVLAGGEVTNNTFEIKGIYFETRFSPIRDQFGNVTGLIGVSVDITERKKAEIQLQQQKQNLESTLAELQRTQSQLIQSEKMSSLGQMVAGIAHEINNPANFIHGNLTPASDYAKDLLDLIILYQEHYPQPAIEIQEKIEAIDFHFIQEDLLNLLHSMQEGTRRIREIVLSLRNFSRLDESEFKLANIHEGLENTLLILHNRLKAKANHPEIIVIKNYGDIPNIECYPGQLNQVFMNILVNAIDALETIESPCITINTKVIARRRLKVEIIDNGAGVPPEVISKLFDPFFTTKEVGKGTGLGLSISYQIIVDKHQGKLYCRSHPGQGTKFIIEIPVTHH